MQDKTAENKYQLSIQFCKSCDSHNWCTHHNELKYKQAYIDLADAVRKQLPEVQIIGNQVPTHLVPIKAKENKYYDSVDKKYVLFPAIGAFQVHFNGVQVFSKKNTNTWPNNAQIINEIYFMIKGEHRKSVECESVQATEKITISEKQQKQTVRMANNVLKSIDDNSTLYPSKKLKNPMTLTDHFKRYKMKKKSQDDLVSLYAQSQSSTGSKISKITPQDIQRLHQIWGNKQKLPNFIMNKALIQEKEGKKQMLVNLSSIQQQAELKQFRINKNQSTKKNKISNLQSDFQKLESKFKKFENRVSQVNRINSDDRVQSQKKDSNIKKFSRFNLVDRIQEIKTAYNAQKLLKHIKDRKKRRIQQYIHASSEQRNEKLELIYGPQYMKQNCSNSKVNFKPKQKLRKSRKTRKTEQENKQDRSSDQSIADEQCDPTVYDQIQPEANFDNNFQQKRQTNSSHSNTLNKNFNSTQSSFKPKPRPIYTREKYTREKLSSNSKGFESLQVFQKQKRLFQSRSLLHKPVQSFQSAKTKNQLRSSAESDLQASTNQQNLRPSDFKSQASQQVSLHTKVEKGHDTKQKINIDKLYSTSTIKLKKSSKRHMRKTSNGNQNNFKNSYRVKQYQISTNLRNSNSQHQQKCEKNQSDLKQETKTNKIIKEKKNKKKIKEKLMHLERESQQQNNQNTTKQANEPVIRINNRSSIKQNKSQLSQKQSPQKKQTKQKQSSSSSVNQKENRSKIKNKAVTNTKTKKSRKNANTESKPSKKYRQVQQIEGIQEEGSGADQASSSSRQQNQEYQNQSDRSYESQQQHEDDITETEQQNQSDLEEQQSQRIKPKQNLQQKQQQKQSKLKSSNKEPSNKIKVKKAKKIKKNVKKSGSQIGEQKQQALHQQSRERNNQSENQDQDSDEHQEQEQNQEQDIMESEEQQQQQEKDEDEEQDQQNVEQKDQQQQFQTKKDKQNFKEKIENKPESKQETRINPDESNITTLGIKHKQQINHNQLNKETNKSKDYNQHQSTPQARKTDVIDQPQSEISANKQQITKNETNQQKPQESVEYSLKNRQSKHTETQDKFVQNNNVHFEVKPRRIFNIDQDRPQMIDVGTQKNAPKVQKQSQTVNKPRIKDYMEEDSQSSASDENQQNIKQANNQVLATDEIKKSTSPIKQKQQSQQIKFKKSSSQSSSKEPQNQIKYNNQQKQNFDARNKHKLKQQEQQFKQQNKIYKYEPAHITKQFYGQLYSSKLKQICQNKNQVSISKGKRSKIFDKDSLQPHLVVDKSGKLANLCKIFSILCARNQFLLIRLVQNPHENKQFNHGVWLCDNFTWKSFEVQSNLNSESLKLHHSNNQHWPQLFTQALCQLFGDFENLCQASIPELFHAFTGSNYLNFKVKEDLEKNNKLLKFISQNEKKNFIILADKRMHNSLGESLQKNDLSVYYVISQRIVNDGEILLRMRKGNADAFWIKLQKFVTEFSQISILQLRVNHNFNTIPIQNCISGHFKIIQLNFIEQSFGCIIISTQNENSQNKNQVFNINNKKLTDFKIYLYKQQQDNVLRLVGQTSDKNKSMTYFDCCFQQGKYLLFLDSKFPSNKICYMGQSCPSISLKQQIQQIGLRSNYTEYIPISSIPSNSKKPEMPKLLNMTLKSQYNGVSTFERIQSKNQENINKSKLKSQFVKYLMNS